MRTSFHHQPEAQHPNFPLSVSWQADYPILRHFSDLGVIFHLSPQSGAKRTLIRSASGLLAQPRRCRYSDPLRRGRGKYVWMSGRHGLGRWRGTTRSSSRAGGAITIRSGCMPHSVQATSTRGVRARLRRVAGCATPTGSAGHAGETVNLKLTFHPDHSMGADQCVTNLFGTLRLLLLLACSPRQVIRCQRPECVGDARRAALTCKQCAPFG